MGNSTQLLPLAAGGQAVALETTVTVTTYGGSVQQGDPRLLNLALNMSQLTTPPLTSDLNFTGQSLALAIVIQTNGWVSDCTPASQQLFLSAMVNITSLPTTSVQLKSCTTFSAVSAGRRHLAANSTAPCSNTAANHLSFSTIFILPGNSSVSAFASVLLTSAVAATALPGTCVPAFNSTTSVTTTTMQLGLLLNVSALLSQYITIQNVSDVFRVLLPYVQPAVASGLGLTTVQVSVSNPMLLLVVNASSTTSDDGGGPVLSIVLIVVVVVLGLGLMLASYMALSTLKRWHNAERAKKLLVASVLRGQEYELASTTAGATSLPDLAYAAATHTARAPGATSHTNPEPPSPHPHRNSIRRHLTQNPQPPNPSTPKPSKPQEEDVTCRGRMVLCFFTHIICCNMHQSAEPHMFRTPSENGEDPTAEVSAHPARYEGKSTGRSGGHDAGVQGSDRGSGRRYGGPHAERRDDHGAGMAVWQPPGEQGFPRVKAPTVSTDVVAPANPARASKAGSIYGGRSNKSMAQQIMSTNAAAAQRGNPVPESPPLPSTLTQDRHTASSNRWSDILVPSILQTASVAAKKPITLPGGLTHISTGGRSSDGRIAGGEGSQTGLIRPERHSIGATAWTRESIRQQQLKTAEHQQKNFDEPPELSKSLGKGSRQQGVGHLEKQLQSAKQQRQQQQAVQAAADAKEDGGRAPRSQDGGGGNAARASFVSRLGAGARSFFSREPGASIDSRESSSQEGEFKSRASESGGGRGGARDSTFLPVDSRDPNASVSGSYGGGRRSAGGNAPRESTGWGDGKSREGSLSGLPADPLAGVSISPQPSFSREQQRGGGTSHRKDMGGGSGMTLGAPPVQRVSRFAPAVLPDPEENAQGSSGVAPHQGPVQEVELFSPTGALRIPPGLLGMLGSAPEVYTPPGPAQPPPVAQDRHYSRNVISPVPRSSGGDMGWEEDVAASGETTVVSGPSKSRLAATLGLHARDLRFLDPALSASYPAAILDRENAILVNLDFIKVIITTEFVIIVNPEDEYVPQLIASMKDIARLYTRTSLEQLPSLNPHAAALAASRDSGSHHHHRHHRHHHAAAAGPHGGSGSEASGSPPDKPTLQPPPNRRMSHEKGIQVFNSLLHRSQLKGGPAAGGGLQLGKVLEHIPNVRSYQGLAEMAAKLGMASVGGTAAAAAAGSGAIELPFELKALEVCLEMTADHIQQDAAELEAEGYPAVDELMQVVGFEQLDRVRLLKNKLSRATARTKTILKLLQAFLDDDMDMHRLNLTAEELSRQGSSLGGADGMQSPTGPNTPLAFGPRAPPTAAALRPPRVPSHVVHMMPHTSPAAQSPRQRSSPFPLSSSSSPPSTSFFPSPLGMLSRHGLAPSSASSSTDSSGFNSEDVAEIAAVEMLLEAYFMHVDKTWHRLETLDEYIKDTEDLVNTKQDKKRNLLTLLNLIFLALFGALSFMVLVTGLFTMNLDNTSNATGTFNPDAIQSQPGVFNLVTGLSTAGGSVFFVVVVVVCHYKKLLF
ncbi:MAG: hypothetical protein WDW36_003314 [Sanguina aurantia]